MRVADPHGTWKKCEQDPRLMVARQPGEFGGEYYRLMPEGLIKNYDGLTIKVNPDLEGLDLNRNFPSGWRQEHEQVGAGEYPTSEPEVKAMVDFIVGHKNIGAAISYHTHSGVILRPMGTESDDDMIPEDLWSIKRFSEIGAKLTGYPAISIWHDFKYHPKDIISGTQDWVYEHLGALFWVVEIWAPNKEAGITDYKWIDWYREHPVEDDLKLIKWSDEQCGGKAHVDWKPFMHPQLGAVEIGGWDKMNYWRNPPPQLREREAARFPKWMTTIALSLPRLELLRTEVRALGPDTWRVRIAVANSGWLPAYVTKRALARKTVRGVIFEIHLPEADRSVSLVSGKPRMEGPQLEGHAPKNSLNAFLPSREITADRAVGEWVVRAPQGHAARARRRAPTAPAPCAPRSSSTDSRCRALEAQAHAAGERVAATRRSSASRAARRRRCRCSSTGSSRSRSRPCGRSCPPATDVVCELAVRHEDQAGADRHRGAELVERRLLVEGRRRS